MEYQHSHPDAKSAVNISSNHDMSKVDICTEWDKSCSNSFCGKTVIPKHQHIWPSVYLRSIIYNLHMEVFIVTGTSMCWRCLHLTWRKTTQAHESMSLTFAQGKFSAPSGQCHFKWNHMLTHTVVQSKCCNRNRNCTRDGNAMQINEYNEMNKMLWVIDNNYITKMLCGL